jgi:hypothetical protein
MALTVTPSSWALISVGNNPSRRISAHNTNCLRQKDASAHHPPIDEQAKNGSPGKSVDKKNTELYGKQYHKTQYFLSGILIPFL